MSFSALTNKPCIKIHHGQVESLWRDKVPSNDTVWHKIVNAVRLNCLIVTKAAEANPDVESEGILNNHSYNVLSCHQFEDGKKKKVRLLKIKNSLGAICW